MSEYIVTTADNGYIVESDEPAMRLVYEGGSQLPPRLMNELLGDLGHAIEEGGGSKFKVTIDVERYDLAARATEHDKGGEG